MIGQKRKPMPTVADNKAMMPRHGGTTLKPGPEWASFEQFRVAGSPGLDAIGNGQVATLRTKAGVFRVLRDEDFQSLVGLAGEVERLKGGLTTIIHAVKVVRDHPTSPSAVELLLHVAAQYVGTPVLPVRQGHELLATEAGPVPEDDEVIVDPAEVRKRVAKR